jgi:hypothetical protein
MFDQNLYDTYYSLEDLHSNLEKLNLDINQFQNLDPVQLFNVAVSNGIEDLAEFLFIHYEIEYELLELMNMTTPVFIPSTDPTNQISDQKSNKIEHLPCGNEGIRIVIEGKENRINRVIKRLVQLKKYSTMRTKDKKFWYKFNKKYIPIFY